MSFASSESGSTFECRLDGGGLGGMQLAEGLHRAGEGAHSFEVRAIDAAGNVDATPASRAWTVDTVAPDTSISAGPVGHDDATSASFVVRLL